MGRERCIAWMPWLGTLAAFATSVARWSYITSLVAFPHWGLEKSLHWCLDITFLEGYNRIRKDQSAESLAFVRQIALDILRQYPAKFSLAKKRRHCVCDNAFLTYVLYSVHA